MKITRRDAATAILTSAALSGQSFNALPRNSDEELEAARTAVRQNLDQLARFPLPMPTEPAVHFKA